MALGFNLFTRSTNVDPTSVWNYFDRIYCITLGERGDRRAEAERQFARVGLGERVEFVVVAKHPENPEQGIYESHLLCLAKGLAAVAERILVFEDDIIFNGFCAERLGTALRGLAGEWELFFLGCLASRSRRGGNANLLKIRYSALTHAYGISRAFAARVVARPWSGIPYDLFLRRAQGEVFALYPAMAFQSNSRSDNWLFSLERFRRLCGGLARIQRLNEWYQRYKYAIILAHLLIVGTLVFLLGARG